MWGGRRIAWGCWHNSCWPFGGEVWGCLRPPGCSAPTPGLLSPRAQARLGVKKAFLEGRWQRCDFSLGRLLPGSQLGIASGAPPASSPQPSDIWVLAAAGGGRRPGASAEAGGRVLGAALGEGLPPAPGHPAGSVTAPGDAPKALERRLGALGETQELAACVYVCAHTCERAARGPTGTSPRPPPAFLGAAVPASEGGAQPKPLGEPPPPTKVPWELKTCLFQDILLRMLYKCLRYAYNN